MTSTTSSAQSCGPKRARTPFHILSKPSGPICNLDCEYCFYLKKQEMFEGSNFRMSDETLENFVRQYIEVQPLGTPEVSFGWQGGEPTLIGVDFFRRAVELQKKYARKGMNISNALQTNGTRLNDEWGIFLHENDFLVGISIDGPKRLHDKFRLDKKGNGSFDQVMAGLEVLKNHKVEFNTLTVVQKDNADHPEEIYQFLKSIGSNFFQFIPIVEYSESDVSYRSVEGEQWGIFLNTILDAWLREDDVGTVFVQAFDNTLAQVMGLIASICVHSPTCGDSVALEHNGDLFSCDHYVTPANKLGNIHEESIADMLNSEKQRCFGSDKQSLLPKQCQECEVLQYCRGACPIDRVATSVHGEAGLQYLCRGYYDFYRHAVPFFEKMAMCLRNRRPASDWRQVGRNNSCPCGSGKKFRWCCGA